MVVVVLVVVVVVVVRGVVFEAARSVYGYCIFGISLYVVLSGCTPV